MQRFWLVWNEKGHAPTFKHSCKRAADAEAKRLARANPGHRFHVLGSLSTIESNDILITPHTDQSFDDSDPFADD